jgi:hypothetical protein
MFEIWTVFFALIVLWWVMELVVARINRKKGEE